MRPSRRALALLGLIGLLALLAAPVEAQKPPEIGAPITVGPDGNEPNIVRAPDGTLYISALQYLYVSTNDGRSWKESPGTLYSMPYSRGGLMVASDSSISVDPKGRLYFTFDYPYAGTTAVCTSDDRAKTFACDAKSVPGGTDRMWVAAPSAKKAYLVTNEGLYQTLLYTSSDRGATWIPQGSTTKGMNSNTGPLIESPKTHEIFQPYSDNATNVTATVAYDSGPLGFHVFDATGSVSGERTTPLRAGAALPSAGFTTDGTLYLVSDMTSHKDESGRPTGAEVVVARSQDQGQKWTRLPVVPGTKRGTASFTAIATGAPGHVGVLFYYTRTGGSADTLGANTTWDVKWAETFDANTAHPTWRVQTVERNVHKGPICSTAGCTGDARFAGDFIAATFGGHGRPCLTWVSEPRGSPVVRFATSAR